MFVEASILSLHINDAVDHGVIQEDLWGTTHFCYDYSKPTVADAGRAAGHPAPQHEKMNLYNLSVAATVIVP